MTITSAESRVRKALRYGFVFFAVLAAALLPVSAQAATKTATLTVKAGNVYYVMDQNISGNGITANKFTAAPDTSGTRYDIVYAANSGGAIIEKCLVNYSKTLQAKAVKGYIKSSAGSNKGILLGIRVRSGSVKLSVASSRSGSSFALKPVKSSKTPLVARTVAKGSRVNFKMNAGNTNYMPLIFGGVTGTTIKRTLSSTRYELYTFKSGSVTCTTYSNKTKVGSKTYKYNSTYTLSRKLYRCVLIFIPANTSSRSSGWMATTKGSACFLYPRSYLGIKYQMK